MFGWFKSAKKDVPPRVEPSLDRSDEKRSASFSLSDGRHIRPVPSGADFKPYVSPVKSVYPDAEPVLAMDSCAGGGAAPDLSNLFYGVAEGVSFFGYPRLAYMASERAEYRHIASAMGEEAIREWGEFFSQGDEDKSEKISQLEAEFKRLNVRHLMGKVLEHDDTFGVGQLFIDMGYEAGSTKNANPLLVGPETVKKGSIKSLNLIEPIWSTPNQYNSSQAIKADFYKPQMWWIQGDNIHHTRLLRFVSREVSTLLKPTYNFGGVPLVQMAKPYVDNWIRTRQSVSDLINGCSIVNLKTEMNSVYMADGIDGLLARIDAFTRMRSNRGVFLTDKESEELQILSANLAGLGDLQNQALEQLCVVAQMPLVKFAGIQPSGLNASSDGEIRVWYDHVSSRQEQTLRPNLEIIMHLAMLNIWGEIDPDIQFRFTPLWQMTESEQATVEKTKAETRGVYVEMGITSTDEARRALANDDASPFMGADITGDAPEPMTDEEADDLHKMIPLQTGA